MERIKRVNIQRAEERREILKLARQDLAHSSDAPSVPGSISGCVIEAFGPIQDVLVCELCQVHTEGQLLLDLHKQANH